MNQCQDCRWWERSDPDDWEGVCHHPLAEAMHIAFTGEPAPYGLKMEAYRPACSVFEEQRGYLEVEWE